MKHNEYIKKVTDRIVTGKDPEWAMDINHFDWVPGVGLYGVLSAYKSNPNQEYLKFLENWVENNKKDAFLLKTVNSTAPFLTIIELYEITGKDEYKKLCQKAAEWIMKEAPITVDGGIEHTVTEPGHDFHDQIWADSLFMVCLFMVKAGKILGERKYVEFAIEQLVVHHKLLKNAENGLYYHGYDGFAKNHMSAVCWGRANAWIIYSTNVILREAGDFVGKEAVIEAMREQIEALENLQHDNGGFSTVLDEMNTYIETSATAGIAAGIYMALQAGYVEEKYKVVADKALAYVMEHTNDKGEVLGVSGGTPVMPSVEAYDHIAIIVTLYGQALAILATVEADAYESNKL